MEFDVNTLEKMQGVIDQALTKIEKYGYTCIAVGPDEETPPFTYSVGMQKPTENLTLSLWDLNPDLRCRLLKNLQVN